VEPDDLLRATGASRAFTERRVSDAEIHAILDDARFAPSGGNRQPWRVVSLRDPSIRSTVVDATRSVWDDYVAITEDGRVPFNVVDGEPPHDVQAGRPNPLIDGIERVPVVLAVAANLREIAAMDAGAERLPLAAGASVYPFCWSILLSASRRGLGGVLTTFVTRVEGSVAEVLGLPEHHALAALIFIGEPERRVSKLSRRPVSSFATIDRFDGSPLDDDHGSLLA